MKLKPVHFLAVMLTVVLAVSAGGLTPVKAKPAQNAATDPANWTCVAYQNSPTTALLHGISLASATDGWAVGNDGVIIRLNGSSWTLADSPTTKLLQGVDMVSSTDGWAVGWDFDGSVFLHWDGKNWSQFATTDSSSWLLGVKMLNSGEGWAVGTGTAAMAPGFRYLDSAWAPVTNPTYGDSLYAVDPVSSDDAWAVGYQGFIMHWDGKNWTKIPTGLDEFFFSIDMVSATDGWIVGSAGIRRYNGTSWDKFTSPYAGLLSVKMLSATSGWIVGAGGLILYWDGVSWTQITSPVTVDLNSVSAVASAAWMVGNGGTIVHCTIGTPSYHVYLPVVMR